MSRTSDPAADLLLGVVLCGGLSQRMGRDKGLIESGGIPWAARLGGILHSLGLPVVYSIRAAQEGAYRVAMGNQGFVADTIETGGPLNGLLSVHRRYPERDLLLLACDMQDMDAPTIGALIGEYRNGGAEGYAYYDGEFAQPLCAIYTAAGLKRSSRGIGEDRSMRAMLARIDVKKLPVKNAAAFGNHNA